MKKIFTFLSAILLLANIAGAQYFQGSFNIDPSNTTNLKLAFKMKPTGNITTGISYMELAFRYLTASTQAFSITDITSNTSTFPGLSIQRFLPDYVAGSYTYVKFVFNTATVPSASYTANTEYQLFTITTTLPASAKPQFDMISNLVLGQYQFGVVNGAGVFLDPGAGAQLYGPYFTIVGNDHILPLLPALPVKFSNFTITNNDNASTLNWIVENQDANTSYFEIERSYDGIEFKKIGAVNANHSLGASVSYSFTDQNPMFDASSTTAYYRVKQVDADGRFVYTETRTMKINIKQAAISLYPNPVLDVTVLSFYLSSASTVRVSITDILGNRVQSFQLAGVAGGNQSKLNIASLSAGIFQVTISAAQWQQTLKLVKK